MDRSNRYSVTLPRDVLFIAGQPDKAREHRLAIDFPSDAIRAGTNTITITSVADSWILYDYASL